MDFLDDSVTLVISLFLCESMFISFHPNKMGHSVMRTHPQNIVVTSQRPWTATLCVSFVGYSQSRKRIDIPRFVTSCCTKVLSLSTRWNRRVVRSTSNTVCRKLLGEFLVLLCSVSSLMNRLSLLLDYVNRCLQVCRADATNMLHHDASIAYVRYLPRPLSEYIRKCRLPHCMHLKEYIYRNVNTNVHFRMVSTSYKYIPAKKIFQMCELICLKCPQPFPFAP